MSKTITLRAHGFTAEIWTQGANVVRLDHQGQHLLYCPENPQPGTEPRRFGCWPMVPMCNRAFDAKLDTGIGIFDLPANDPAGTNIHGDGWQAEWTVEHLTDNRVVLRHVAFKFGPYAYVARMALTLEAGGVNFDLALTNLSHATLPFGMGFHPWFPCNTETRISFSAAGEVYMREGFRPESHGPVRADNDFTLPHAPRQPQNGVDHEIAANYTGWDGKMRLDWPNRGKSLNLLASPNLRHPVLWSPVGADFVCFEPQSHAVGAQTEGLIRAIAPLTMLAHGQSLNGAMRLVPEDLT